MASHVAPPRVYPLFPLYVWFPTRLILITVVFEMFTCGCQGCHATKPAPGFACNSVGIHVLGTSGTLLGLLFLVGASSTVNVHSDHFSSSTRPRGTSPFSLTFSFALDLLKLAGDCACNRPAVRIISQHGRNPVAFVPDFPLNQPPSSELLNLSS